MSEKLRQQQQRQKWKDQSESSGSSSDNNDNNNIFAAFAYLDLFRSFSFLRAEDQIKSLYSTCPPAFTHALLEVCANFLIDNVVGKLTAKEKSVLTDYRAELKLLCNKETITIEKAEKIFYRNPLLLLAIARLLVKYDATTPPISSRRRKSYQNQSGNNKINSSDNSTSNDEEK